MLEERTEKNCKINKVMVDRGTGKEGNEVDQIKGSKNFQRSLVPNRIAYSQIRSDAVILKY